MSLLNLVWDAGLVAKAILGVLLLFSIISWALMVEKWWQFRRVRGQTVGFLRAFREARRPSIAQVAAKKHRDSPLAAMYSAAYQEATDDPEDDGATERLDAAERAMRRTAVLEIARLERYLPFLATTASATPFIGLFGTVVGIMSAFHGIGAQGSASLAVVAPGISEALVATAAGLGAAIPAVMAYNFFVNRVKHWATEMDAFMLDLLNAMSRPAKMARQAKDGV